MVSPTVAQVATVIRAVLLSRTPTTARRIDLLTGYGRSLILSVLTELQMAGDVECVEISLNQAYWRPTTRWALT